MNNLRSEFPFFDQTNQVVFFDSAASTLKPKAMIDRLSLFYSFEYANIHRGIYNLSANATKNFEDTRNIVAKFINASSSDEIIFTKNATEGINLIAYAFSENVILPGDEILISAMEHHANIIPWQQVCKKKQAKLKIIPINNKGEVILDEVKKLINKKTKIISITQMSNIYGSVVNIKEIVNIAKEHNIKVVVDACQSIAHMNIDVRSIDCDFMVFSSHKIYGPTGVGILYGKKSLLDKMPPYQTGGATIKNVEYFDSSFLSAPLKFEAGTPMIAEVIAFGAVLKFLKQKKWHQYWKNEKDLTQFIRSEIKKIAGYKLLGENNNCIISLLHEKAHHSDIGEMLNQQNIAIRTGHHCAQPLMKSLSIPGTARISVGIYNNFADAEKLIAALKEINKFF